MLGSCSNARQTPNCNGSVMRRLWRVQSATAGEHSKIGQASQVALKQRPSGASCALEAYQRLPRTDIHKEHSGALRRTLAEKFTISYQWISDASAQADEPEEATCWSMHLHTNHLSKDLIDWDSNQ